MNDATQFAQELARQRNRVTSARMRARMAADSFALFTRELVAAAQGADPERAQVAWVGTHGADVVAAFAVLGAEVDRLKEMERAAQRDA